MRRRDVIFSPEARNDLLNLYDRIAAKAGPEIAIGYIERIEAFCHGFDLASKRGQLRGDIRPGLRIVGFERASQSPFQWTKSGLRFSACSMAGGTGKSCCTNEK